MKLSPKITISHSAFSLTLTANGSSIIYVRNLLLVCALNVEATAGMMLSVKGEDQRLEAS